MKLLAILAASLALALAGCNRDNSAGAGGTSSMGKSPSSATGSSSGSTSGGAASGSSSSPSGSPGSSSSSKRPRSNGK